MSQTAPTLLAFKSASIGYLLPAWFSASDLWDSIKGVTHDALLLWCMTALILVGGALYSLAPARRKRIKAAVALFSVAVLASFLAAGLRSAGITGIGNFLLSITELFEGAALINLSCVLLFDVFLKWIRIDTPRIIRDLSLAIAYVSMLLVHLSYRGVNISGIVATSAVITAVIAFSLQDTLGNIMGGLALQMERTINVGDWIQVDKHVGRVVELRWRQTTIETRRWDTVIIPNSQLMKGQIVIIGRRIGQPVQERQELYFHVDPRHTPLSVIKAVEDALRSSAMNGVAMSPPPDCVLDEFKESYIQYCVRYWLANLSSDMPTSGEVRTRIYYGLRRNGIPVSIPAQRIFLTTETEERRHSKEDQQQAKKIDILQNLALFRSLTDEERENVAAHLQPVPFMRGEEITRQGDIGYWLFIILSGTAEVRISTGNGLSKAVAVLKAGDLLGEMSLMTGEPRTATVVALEEVQCYRLDKESFNATLASRPELAEDFSQILAQRRVELEAAREGLDAEDKKRRFAATQSDIRLRIYRFFGLQSHKAPR
jgi:small-conductance mechanosensitive channel/CRP-like cAMP-binding protein